MIPEPQITFKDKAQPYEKAQHIEKYVSIVKMAATLPLGVRGGIETTSTGR
jgi:hypothetical protein